MRNSARFLLFLVISVAHKKISSGKRLKGCCANGSSGRLAARTVCSPPCRTWRRRSSWTDGYSTLRVFAHPIRWKGRKTPGWIKTLPLAYKLSKIYRRSRRGIAPSYRYTVRDTREIQGGLGLQFRSELLAELDHFRPDDGCTITLKGIPRKIFLVIGLSFVPGPGRSNFRDNRIGIALLVCHSSDHLLGNLLLIRRMVENGRSVLSPDIMSLPVEGRGIVYDKQYFDQLTITDDVWVECNTDGFCVTGPAATDGFIRRMIDLTSHIAGFDRNHTFYLIIDRFKTPKTTACYGCNGISGLS